MDDLAAKVRSGRAEMDDVFAAKHETSRHTGQTLLHVASESDKTLKYVRGLLGAGADVNAQDRQGWTPLHIAAFYGASEVVERLLAEGADPALVTRRGETARMLAKTKSLRNQLGHDLVAPGGFTTADSSAANAHLLPDFALEPAAEAAAGPRATGRLEPRRPEPSAIFPRLRGVGRKTRHRRKRNRTKRQ